MPAVVSLPKLPSLTWAIFGASRVPTNPSAVCCSGWACSWYQQQPQAQCTCRRPGVDLNLCVSAAATAAHAQGSPGGLHPRLPPQKEGLCADADQAPEMRSCCSGGSRHWLVECGWTVREMLWLPGLCQAASQPQFVPQGKHGQFDTELEASNAAAAAWADAYGASFVRGLTQASAPACTAHTRAFTQCMVGQKA